jgi:hypothetical protein
MHMSTCICQTPISPLHWRKNEKMQAGLPFVKGKSGLHFSAANVRLPAGDWGPS